MTKTDAKRLLEIYDRVKYYRIGRYMGIKTYIDYVKFKKESKPRRDKYDDDLFVYRTWLLLFPIFPEVMMLVTYFLACIVADFWWSLNGKGGSVSLYHCILWSPFFILGSKWILINRAEVGFEVTENQLRLMEIIDPSQKRYK